MIKSYLKIGWRNLIRHKSFSFINIGGLSIGIAACLLISLYVDYELGYDAFHLKKDRIVRIANTMHTPEADNVTVALTPALLATTLNHNYLEVEKAVRFEPTHGTVKVNDQLYKVEFSYKADSGIFDVFSFRFAKGSAKDALADPRNIVLTEKLAKKFFGEGDAMGKNIICNKVLYHVSAVLKNLPENSDLKIDLLIPADYSKTTAWLADDFSVYTFVLFKPGFNLAAFNNKLKQISKQNVQPELNKIGAVKYSLQFKIEPLNDVHFVTGDMGDMVKGDRQMVYVFSVISVSILLIALLNYINLSTARATERAKEVSVRKVNGALRGSLIRQFLFESFFVTAIALILGIALLFIMLPFFNSLLQIRISLLWSSYSFYLICILILASSFITGLYPAFVLSSFQPITTLKGNTKGATRGLTLRKGITVIQFVIATVMIAGAFIMNRQINFVKLSSAGYNRDQVMNISLPDDSVALQRLNPFNNALKQLSQVKGTAVQTGLTMNEGAPIKSTTFTFANGIKRELMINYFFIDEKFIPMLNIPLSAGRNLEPGRPTDKKEGFIVNEAFVQQMGWKKPVGQSIEGFDNKGHVIGVVKNFHYSSMHNPIEPLILVYNIKKPVSILVKVNPGDLSLVKGAWKTYFPDVPFDFYFMDAAFDTIYKKDITSIKLFNYFTGLSVVLACLGLYGLALLIATQRTKEIGIRKVLGAAVGQLLVLLATDFVKLTAIAALLALPVTWLVMNKWLNSYAYHISISIWLLAAPVFAILLIATLVISYQTIKIALNNPVKSLKSE